MSDPIGRHSRSPDLVDDADSPESAVAAVQSAMEALATQARWLLEYHGRRADSASQRAVAALAADGLLLGLIATAVRSGAATLSGVEQGAVVAATVLVVVSAVFSIGAVEPRSTYAPRVHDLQELLARSDSDLQGQVHRGIVLTLLGMPGSDTGANPVAQAASEAAARVGRLTWSVRALAAAFTAVVVFVVLTVISS